MVVVPKPVRVLYSAAHAVESSESIPLGGGASICRLLTEEWKSTQQFELRIIGPAVLGERAPTGRAIVNFSESQYARFCLEFEAAATREILQYDPRSTVVLVNDVSEAPSFRILAEAGFPIATIYHVDVVAYVAAIYGRGWIKPETTVRWYERLRLLPLPSVLKLVWEKQLQSIRYSQKLIVPSTQMKDVLEACYPADAPGKIAVLPWGVPAKPPASLDLDALRGEYHLPADALVLLTLSRISPEKGQDLLLEALLAWEKSADFPQRPVSLFVCGAPAFMQGERHYARLKALAARLKHIRVFFPGHITGTRKDSFFALADVYIFPSTHESYGLTLIEALQAGLPCICVGHSGALEVMRPDLGITVPLGPRSSIVAGLHRAIAELSADETRRNTIRAAAQAYAAGHSFEETAGTLARMLANRLG